MELAVLMSNKCEKNHSLLMEKGIMEDIIKLYNTEDILVKYNTIEIFSNLGETEHNACFL